MDISFEENANNEANEVLKPNGELSHTNLRDLTEILETDPQFQQMFLQGDSADQTQALNNVEKLAQQVQDYKKQRKINATLWSNQNTPGGVLNNKGYSVGLQDFPEARRTLGNYNNVDSMGFSAIKDDIDNTIGFDVGFSEDDGSITVAERANQLSSMFTVDNESASEITKVRNLMSGQAKNGDHKSTFDEAQVRRAINTVVKKGKHVSLIYDPLLKESSLREDLISSGLLSKINYEDLGLTDVKGGLAEADQKDLLNNLFKNPKLGKQRQALITDYYTQLVKQEWDAQHQVHVNNYNKSLAAAEQATKTQTPTVNGGQINSQGVYVPNK